MIATSKRNWGWKLGLASLVAPSIAIAQSARFANVVSGNCALAQITPDSTLGAESSVVTPNAGNVDEISGGATRGANLFHSFEQFSVLNGRSAFFNNAASIQNIISRITGGSISNIDGLLRANGTANLFLINPNGISFGPNASLNIGGSFVGSTASAVNFADGVFSATNPQATPLLTVNVPIGLQYGGTEGSILSQSKATDGSGATVGLAVQPGKTLALVGGNVQLNGGSLFARSGRVELGGVAGAGTVGLNVDSSNLSLSFPDLARTEVSLTNGAEVNVRAFGGGSIAINAQNLNLAGESKLRAGIDSGLGSPESRAGDIDINANGAIALTDGSFIANVVQTGAVGKGGGINITTGSVSVTDGARLVASTFGQGDAGSVNINARDRVSFDGVSSDGSLLTGAFSTVQPEAVGKGGGINITTGSLSVTNGAQLAASTGGRGDAGSVNINARDTVSFDGVSSDGSLRSGAFSTVQPEAVGKGGGINVTTGSLSVTDGAQLTASTFGQGDAGSVNINARDRVSFDLVSGAYSTVESGAVGKGGDINITTGSLSVTYVAQLAASTRGQGDAGSVNINARDSVSFDLVSGAYSTVGSGAVGKGGDINITTRSLEVTNGAELSTSSAGNGAAGNIEVTADSILLDDQGELTAETASGQGGNITLRDLNLLLLRNNSKISTTAGTQQAGGDGGDITINTDLLVALQNSDIAANAFEGQGGKIQINTQGFFLSPNSEITASSSRGIDGVVEINNPDVDPEQGLVELPAELVDASNQIVSSSCPAGGENKFTVTGRGGLPPNPREPLSGEAVLTNWATLEGSREQGAGSRENSSTNSTSSAPNQIVEATGWVVNSKGEVVLTAAAPTAPLDIPWLPSSDCHASKPSSNK